MILPPSQVWRQTAPHSKAFKLLSTKNGLGGPVLPGNALCEGPVGHQAGETSCQWVPKTFLVSASPRKTEHGCATRCHGQRALCQTQMRCSGRAAPARPHRAAPPLPRARARAKHRGGRAELLCASFHFINAFLFYGIASLREGLKRDTSVLNH